MVNPKNARNKKEHFGFMSTIEDIITNKYTLAMIIGAIILIIAAIFFYMYYTRTHSSSAMNFLSDTSPMAPLTATPSM